MITAMEKLKYQTPEDRWKVIPDIDKGGDSGDRYDWKQGYGCALRDHAAPLELEVQRLKTAQELRFSEEQVKQMLRDIIWYRKDLGKTMEKMGMVGGL